MDDSFPLCLCVNLKQRFGWKLIRNASLVKEEQSYLRILEILNQFQRLQNQWICLIVMHGLK